MTSAFGGNMQELLQRTANAIALQPALPMSPGVMSDGRPMLCAAAALVHQAAGLASPGTDMAQLAENMVRQGRGYILELGSRLGLDSELVSTVMKKNDSCQPTDRRERMIEFIQALAV